MCNSRSARLRSSLRRHSARIPSAKSAERQLCRPASANHRACRTNTSTHQRWARARRIQCILAANDAPRQEWDYASVLASRAQCTHTDRLTVAALPRESKPRASHGSCCGCTSFSHLGGSCALHPVRTSCDLRAASEGTRRDAAGARCENLPRSLWFGACRTQDTASARDSVRNCCFSRLQTRTSVSDDCPGSIEKTIAQDFQWGKARESSECAPSGQLCRPFFNLATGQPAARKPRDRTARGPRSLLPAENRKTSFEVMREI